jgi:hypothetical protein
VHVAVDDVPAEPSAAECEHIVTTIATSLAEFGDAAMLVALTRPGQDRIGSTDRQWFHAVHEGCRGLDVGVLGVYVVTRHDIVQVQLDDV